ncbi:putative Alpha-mannosidase I MNS4 [Paratrimastix pyriformis]|uniref:alpha-1,2-Mannosidase n=1 Tax=Paratrimastix pyriformis TaxID=342808 RepID=A0ABQ8UH00_9EUKA|nr:putative Alpha-mannosidase I MNS4 [Paratrimastix pyriformis]
MRWWLFFPMLFVLALSDISEESMLLPEPSQFSDEGLLEGVDNAEQKALRLEVSEMFFHAYGAYMAHGYPADEVTPISCHQRTSYLGFVACVFIKASFFKTRGGLLLFDVLDTLAVMGNMSAFFEAVQLACYDPQIALFFERNKTVSLFEINIRVLGGLLSAHILAEGSFPTYDGCLLEQARRLGQKLVPAFDTPTGIPYGSVNLATGVHKNESALTATATGGTLALEFGLLSSLLKDPQYERLARRAAVALFQRRSNLDLLGNHINIITGSWTHQDAGIGGSMDSYFEYLLKAALVFGDSEYSRMFQTCYKAIMTNLAKGPWYVDVQMSSGQVTWPLFASLQAFWPGLQVVSGPALELTTRPLYGALPEGYNLLTQESQPGQEGYPLRPELAESCLYLYTATHDRLYLKVGRSIVSALQTLRASCGYHGLESVNRRSPRDKMESFFLSETLKYLYLLFSEPPLDPVMCEDDLADSDLDAQSTMSSAIPSPRAVELLTPTTDPDPVVPVLSFPVTPHPTAPSSPVEQDIVDLHPIFHAFTTEAHWVPILPHFVNPSPPTHPPLRTQTAPSPWGMSCPLQGYESKYSADGVDLGSIEGIAPEVPNAPGVAAIRAWLDGLQGKQRA